MDTREQYIEKLKTQLDQWNAELKKWEAKAHDAQADMRVEYEKQLEEFRRQRDKAAEEMRHVQTAAGNAWLDFMRSADDAWAKTREAFEKAQSHFRK
jgi:hypothetical protein